MKYNPNNGKYLLFQGCENVIFEFNDIIACPGYEFMKDVSNNDCHGSVLNELFHLTNYKNIDVDNWYINREFNNPLSQINWDNGLLLTSKACDLIYNNEILSIYKYYKYYPKNIIFKIINTMNQIDVSSKIIVWSKYYNSHINSFIKDYLSSYGCIYYYGNFPDIIKSLSLYSTFVLSSIDSIKSFTELEYNKCRQLTIIDSNYLLRSNVYKNLIKQLVKLPQIGSIKLSTILENNI